MEFAFRGLHHDGARRVAGEVERFAGAGAASSGDTGAAADGASIAVTAPCTVASSVAENCPTASSRAATGVEIAANTATAHSALQTRHTSPAVARPERSKRFSCSCFVTSAIPRGISRSDPNADAQRPSQRPLWPPTIGTKFSEYGRPYKALCMDPEVIAATCGLRATAIRRGCRWLLRCRGRTALLTADAVGKTMPSMLSTENDSQRSISSLLFAARILLIPAQGEERRRATTAFAN